MQLDGQIKRSSPTGDKQTHWKKPKLDDGDGHDEWSGFYTIKQLEQWMGPHFAHIIEKEAPFRLSKQGSGKPDLRQFIVTHKMVQSYNDSNRTKVGVTHEMLQIHYDIMESNTLYYTAKHSLSQGCYPPTCMELVD